MCHIVATFREPAFFPFRKIGRPGVFARISVLAAVSALFAVAGYLDDDLTPSLSQRIGVILAVLFLMLLLDVPNFKRYVIVRTDGLSTISPFFFGSPYSLLNPDQCNWRSTTAITLSQPDPDGDFGILRVEQKYSHAIVVGILKKDFQRLIGALKSLDLVVQTSADI